MMLRVQLLLITQDVEKSQILETRYTYSCSVCPEGHKYRCETCFAKNGGHNHGCLDLEDDEATVAFEPNLTKLVSEYLTLALDESQKCNFFCSNSKNGCEEEFLALKALPYHSI